MKKKIFICLSILIFLSVSSIVIYTTKKNMSVQEDLKTIDKIADIVNRKNDLNKLYIKDNNEEVEYEINECDKLIDELHSINSSGAIRNDYLVNIMNNSIEAIINKKASLQCSKNLDLKSYSEYNKKESYNVEQIKLNIQRFKADNDVE